MPWPHLLADRRLGPGELGGLRRGTEMVSEQLGELVPPASGQLLEPGADLSVGSGTLDLRDGPVGHVVDEGVPEAQLRLPGQGGGWPPDDESTPLQTAQAGGDRLHAERPLDRVLPEDPPDHRRLLKDPLVGCGKGVDAGGQQRLQAVRERAHPSFGQVQDELLEEQRVALRPGQHLLAQPFCQTSRRREAVKEPAAVPVGQWPQGDRGEALTRLATGPA